MSVLRSVILALLACTAPSATCAQDWPWWRGPARDGVAPSEEWSSSGRELWRRSVGVGFVCPVVVGDRLWTAGHDAGTKLDTAFCLDAERGGTLWSASWPARRGGYDVHPGGPLGSPAVGDGRVFFVSNEGVVRALEAEHGTLLWTRELARELGSKPGEYGFGASPVLLGDTLLVCVDRIAALDVATGESRWTSEPLGAYHATPAPCVLSGVVRLAVFGQERVSVLDPLDGALRGALPWHEGHVGKSIATPVVLGEHLFVSAGEGIGGALLDFTTDPPRTLWKTRALRSAITGCVRVGPALYGFDESILCCLDLDGRQRWRERGLGDGSLIAAGGRLIVLDADGVLRIVRATVDGYRELARLALFSEGNFWAPPVFSHGRIYTRSSLGELVCTDHRGGEAPPASAEVPRGATVELPTATSLFERHLELVGGRARVEALVSVRRAGTFQRRALGVVSVPVTLEERAPALRREEIGLPRGLPGKVVRAFDGDLAWELNPIRGDALRDEAGQREARDEPGLHAAASFARDHRELRTVEAVPFAGRRAWKVAATLVSGAARNYYFDTETGYLLGRDGEDQAEVVLGEWRTERGLAFPMLERREERDTGALEVVRFTTLELDSVSAEAFRRPGGLTRPGQEVPPK